MDPEVDKRFQKIDKRLDAITKLIHVGMKLVVQVGERQKEDRESIHALIAAQMRTDQKLDRLITVLLKTGRNGR
ncbi:MAG: hypothetical protein HY236_16445 [Acidobacteria bacterium]|nr:hypothetical protein [Acidobacteriota bacterium]